jgi:hypothetical protein
MVSAFLGTVVDRQDLLVAILQTSKKISIVPAGFGTLCHRQVAKTILLLAQGAVSDRVIPTTGIKPPCQFVDAKPVGSAADLIRVTVASHITTTVSLRDCVLIQATATIAFTYLGSASLYRDWTGLPGLPPYSTPARV